MLNNAINNPTIGQVYNYSPVSGAYDERLPETPYILAQVEANKVALICLTDGNRFTDPSNMASPPFLTEEEREVVTGGDTKHFIRKVK